MRDVGDLPGATVRQEAEAILSMRFSGGQANSQAFNKPTIVKPKNSLVAGTLR